MSNDRPHSITDYLAYGNVDWRLRLPGIAALLVLIVLTGCASYSDAMKSWMGSTEHELILEWGPPTRTASNGADGRILTYEFERGGGRIHVNDNGDVTARPSQVSTRMFYVNAKGIIYSWRWQGL